MSRHRTTAALALALFVGLGTGCADMTTTGVPEEGASEEAMATNPLAGTAWVLTSSTVADLPVDGTEITIEFDAEELGGQATVNSYVAGYTVAGDQIEIGEIGSTLMAGPDPLMAAESEYTALLGAVETFQLGDDLLTLEAGDGGFLGYEAPDSSEAGGGSETAIPAETTAVAESVVGMSLDDAQQAAEDAELTLRVVSTDGEAAAVTQDYRTDRINVEVVDDEVVAATVG